MLISHEKKFIILKTMNAMSTPVELAFQDYCAAGLSGDVRQEMIVTPKGIVGARGSFGGDQVPDYYNHMHAKKLAQLLGKKIWGKYLKVAVIRNPFDNILAAYLYSLESDMPEITPEEPTVGGFTDFIKQNASRYYNWHILTIGGGDSLDFALNYDTFRADLKEFCKHINVKYSDISGKIPSAMKAVRKNEWKKFYNQENIDLVASIFKKEIELFGFGYPWTKK